MIRSENLTRLLLSIPVSLPSVRCSVSDPSWLVCGRLDRQMSLQQEVEDASAAASSRKEKSDRTMREANWVKPICDAIRHRHWKQLRKPPPQ